VTTHDHDRLQRRLERERRARRQAEIIAERGMRELWQANSELQERVTTRTSQLERTLRALGYRNHARSLIIERSVSAALDALDASAVPAEVPTEVRGSLEHVRRILTTPAAPPIDEAMTTLDPVDLADELVARWQHDAARRGQLLSVEVGDAASELVVDWAAVQAVADTLLDGCLRHSAPGALLVTLSVSGDRVTVSTTDSGPGLDGHAVTAALTRPERWGEIGPFGDVLAIAQVIAERVDGDLQVGCDDAATAVTATFPAGPGSTG
jgi:hypothetical protein